MKTIALTLFVAVSAFLVAPIVSAREEFYPDKRDTVGEASRRMIKQASSPTKNWANRPLKVTLSIATTNIYAELNEPFTIAIERASRSYPLGDRTDFSDDQGKQIQTNTAFISLEGVGAGCDVGTNAGSGSVDLVTDRVYYLTVSGTKLEAFQILLGAGNGLVLLNPRDKKAVPMGYRVFINQKEDTLISESTSSCQKYTNTWNIIIRRDPNPKWRHADDDDEPSAPGDAEWAEIGPGKSRLTNRCAMRWSVSLGNIFDGTPLGKLSIAEDSITKDLFTPATLYYASRSTNLETQIEMVITNLSELVLRQLRCPQAFVDIVPQTNQYELRFYHAAAVGTQTNQHGIYTNFTESPYVTWRISNPDQDPAVTNRLHIVETRNGITTTNKIEFDVSQQKWFLKYGTGGEERVETRTVTFDAQTNRVETIEIKYANGSNAYKATETYQKSLFGWQLIQNVVDPNGAALSTTDEYYANENQYVDGQLKSITYPDGHWEKRIYADDWEDGSVVPGGLWFVLRPWLDSPATPSEASIGNSWVTRYLYDFAMSVRVPSYIEEVLNGDGETSGLNSILKESVFTESTWSDKQIRSQKDYLVGGGVSAQVGEWTEFYKDDLELGLAGKQTAVSVASGPVRFMYYDGGVYNPSTHSFSDVTNVFTSGDWRMTELFGCRRAGWDDQDDDDTRDPIDEIEGHPIQLYWAGDMAVSPFKSWKDVTIMHDNVMAQKEKWVYTELVANDPQFELVDKQYYLTDTLGHVTNITRVDPQTAVERIIYSADWRGTDSVDGDLKFSEIDENGVETVFTYDSLKRIQSITKKGIASGSGYPSQDDVATVWTYDAQSRKLKEITLGGTLGLTNALGFDRAGRPTAETNTAGLVTLYSHSNGGRITTKTLPNGATEITENYLDRRIKSRTGTGLISEYHNYLHAYGAGIPADNGKLETSGSRVRTADIIHYGAIDSNRVVTNEFDDIGRLIRTEFGGYLVETNRDVQKLDAISHSGGPIVWFHYDAMWNLSAVVTNVDLTSGVSFDSKDRILTTDTFFRKIGSDWFQVITNATYLTDESSTPTVIDIQTHRLTGFSSGVQTQSSVTDADGQTTTIMTSIDRANKKLTEIIDISTSTLDATNVTINGLLQSESTPTIASPTRHFYDSLGREIQVIDPLGFSMGTCYDAGMGRKTATTNKSSVVTSYEYYSSGHINAGQLKCHTAPNLKKTYYAYNSRGQVIRRWGDVPYPEERVYDSFGEMSELRTFRGGENWNGSNWPSSPGTADVTTWAYEPATGLLQSKTDAAEKAVSYAYTNMMLWTKTWARGASMTNMYVLGDLVQTEYSDSTPTLRFTNHSRAGLPGLIVDGEGEHTLVYDSQNRMISTTCNGITLSNHFDAVYGRDTLTLIGTDTTMHHEFDYDSHGRLSSVVSGIYSALYGYKSNSDLLESTTFKNNGTTGLTTTRLYENGYRLFDIENVVGSTIVSGDEYEYDSVDRRAKRILADNSYWNYAYNNRNEVTSAKPVWQDNSHVAGQQFEFGFDNIGNRTQTRSGGDRFGRNLRSETWTANTLNQISDRTVAGAIDIVGTATNVATVTVNNTSAERHDDYFRAEVPVANNSYQQFLTRAVMADGANDLMRVETNHVFVSPSTQTLLYDWDGNLTNDGQWIFAWDAQNQLIQMTNTTAVPTNARMKLTFTYDYQGRRTAKRVYPWNGATTNWADTPVLDLRFVYDGWNLLVELNGTNSVRNYVWGQDLGGAMDSAGGIGGLLTIRDNSSSTTHFICYDGNGNVAATINASNSSISGQYEYGAFGEMIRATGDFGEINRFRFSTKYADEQSGLLYYGFRYYNPTIGKWINRDPIEEEGGVNLYGFLANNALTSVDVLGMAQSQQPSYGVSDPRFWRFIHDQIKPIYGRDMTKEEVLAEYEDWKQSKPKGSRGEPDWKSKTRGSRGGRASGLIGALFLIGSITTSVASGEADQNAVSLANNFQDYLNHRESGDTAWMELDAIMIALDLQNMGMGSAALWAWDALTE